MIRQFLRSFVVPALIVAGLSANAFAGNADEAKAFVDKVGGQALGILKNDSLSQDAKISQLNTMFMQAVDVEYVGKFVLGRYWKTITPQQQQDYLAAYKPFVVKNYVSRVARYAGQTYTLTDAQPTDDGATVGMVLHTPDGSSPDVTVNYRLTKVGGSFKVIDIVVEGVSLLNTQRSEFGSVVANKGIDYLTEQLKAKAGK